MDENRVQGAARKVVGKAEGALGDVTGDTKTQLEGRAREMSGATQQAYGQAKDAAADVVDDTADQLAKLRAQVESLLNEKVTPALANMADSAEGYARDARAAVQVQADHAAERIRERPLTMVAAIAACAFLLGRITGATHVHYHD